MPISEELFDYVQRLQSKADSSLLLYPENDNLLPNDALYLHRVANLRSVCEMIQSLVTESGMTLSLVLAKAVRPEIDSISATFPFTRSALEAIIDHYCHE